jgi:hypothetical protein
VEIIVQSCNGLQNRLQGMPVGGNFQDVFRESIRVENLQFHIWVSKTQELVLFEQTCQCEITGQHAVKFGAKYTSYYSELNKITGIELKTNLFSSKFGREKKKQKIFLLQRRQQNREIFRTSANCFVKERTT